MDLRELKDQATQAFAKGRFAKAADLWTQYCAGDPRDHQARLRLGDTWAKAGQSERAIGAYQAAAQGFAREGFLPRAIAASKLILELDPSHRDVQRMLADLYAARGTPADSRNLRPGAGSPSSPTAQRSATPQPLVERAAPSGPADASLALDVTSPDFDEAPTQRHLVVSSSSEAPTEKHSILPTLVDSPTEKHSVASDEGESLLPLEPVPLERESSAVPVDLSDELPLELALVPEQQLPHALQDVAAPPPEPPPAVPPGLRPRRANTMTEVSAPARVAELDPEMPSGGFTELELDSSDSLLQALEGAARAAAEAHVEDEETVFSLTEDMVSEEPAPGALPHIPLFSDLPPEAFIALFERCPLRRFPLGARILEQGTVGSAFFVICEGQVRVLRKDEATERELALLKEGDFFGEMALLSGAPRTASVESAAEDTQVLELSAEVLTELARAYPQVARALKKFCRDRMLTNVMNGSALFRLFDRRDRRQLIERFRAREVRRAEVLVRAGERSDGLYVVLSGEVEVRKEGQPLARLREGELFGEMSLLHKAPATADVVAMRRTSLLRLPREDFDALISSHPQILMHVAELTAERSSS